MSVSMGELLVLVMKNWCEGILTMNSFNTFVDDCTSNIPNTSGGPFSVNTSTTRSNRSFLPTKCSMFQLANENVLAI
jgi:hypothetical protein